MPLSFPASPTNGQQSIQNGRTYVWNGTNAWELVATVPSHASSHATGGTDAITPASISAAPAANPTFTGVVTVAAGSVSAPAITTTGDTNNGIYFPGADQIAVTTNGVQRIHVNSTGNVGIGTTAATARTLLIGTDLTGSTGAYGIVQQGTVQSDVTVGTNGILNTLNTAAAAFTLASYVHYAAAQGTIGANSAVTAQTGFLVDTSLTGATNNYAFRSQLAAATGRWNAYFDGTGQNWFAGNVGIGASRSTPSSALDVNGVITVAAGSVSAPALTATGDTNTGIYFPATDSISVATGGVQRINVNSAGEVGIGVAGTAGRTVLISKNLTGATSYFGVIQQGVVQSDVTVGVTGFYNILNAQSASFTLGSYTHFLCASNALAGGAALTSQFGFSVSSTLNGATNNYGFRGSIAAATGCWNAYMDGTAQNFFAGNVGIGTGRNTPSVALDVNGVIAASTAIGINTTSVTGYVVRAAKAITGAVTSYAYTQEGTVQSDVTSGAVSFISQANTQAAAFTLPAFTHFSATQGTIGASSAITTQTGFLAQGTLTGATNNYGFRGLIGAASGCWNLYIDGTAQNYFGGNVGIGSGASAPTSALDIASDNIRLRTAKTPTGPTDTGTAGQICWDANYIYVCTASNTWRRAALTPWEGELAAMRLYLWSNFR